METRKNLCRSRTTKAFTRLELCAVLAAIALLGVIVFPTLAGTKSDTDRSLCVNNLRLIGRGMASWAGDHNGYFSWWVPLSDGGTRPGFSKPASAWFEYSSFSNYLVSPKILACPADRGVIVARSFPEYRQVGFRDSATSYNLNLHAYSESSRIGICTDRNLKSDTLSGCSTGMNPIWQINAESASAGWTNAVHGTGVGNIVMTDGSVITSIGSPVALLQESNASTHILQAR
jgi:hypothetical protein